MSKQRQVNNLREGDRIRHFDLTIGEKGENVEGVVQSVLSVQFTYLDPEGHVRFCMFNEQWVAI